MEQSANELVGLDLGRARRLGRMMVASTGFHLTDFPFWHARPIVLGSDIYIMGQAGDVFIIRSRDNGETWSKVHALTSGEKWNSAATNYLVEDDFVYLVMDHRADNEVTGWNVAGLAPRVWRGQKNADLLFRESWSVSDALTFNQFVEHSVGDHFGIPFYPTLRDRPIRLSDDIQSSPMGWLEGNVVRISDPSHIWNDPSKRSLHVIMRVNTAGNAGYAAMVRIQENPDGTMTTHHQTSPSGRKLTFFPFPGGHLKFYILYDQPSQLYWLASSQASDSLCRLDAIPSGRVNLPDNERNRLFLYWSKNCVDWVPAGLICKGENDRHARNYPSMIVSGSDLIVACRSGDDESKDGQYSNLVTVHKIQNFRSRVI